MNPTFLAILTAKYKEHAVSLYLAVPARHLRSGGTVTDYDSTAETLRHSLRVGELMGALIRELVDRSVKHDLSKTEDPELAWV